MTNEQLAESVARVKELNAKRRQGSYIAVHGKKYTGVIFADTVSVSSDGIEQPIRVCEVSTAYCSVNDAAFIAAAPQMAAFIAQLWDEREALCGTVESQKQTFDALAKKYAQQDAIIQQQRDVMRMARDAIDKMRYHTSMVMIRENGAEACGMIEVIAAPAADALDAALKGSE